MNESTEIVSAKQGQWTHLGTAVVCGECNMTINLSASDAETLKAMDHHFFWVCASGHTFMVPEWHGTKPARPATAEDIARIVPVAAAEPEAIVQDGTYMSIAELREAAGLPPEKSFCQVLYRREVSETLTRCIDDLTAIQDKTHDQVLERLQARILEDLQSLLAPITLATEFDEAPGVGQSNYEEDELPF